MKRLEPPTCCASDLLDLCIQEMPDVGLQKRLRDQKPLLEAEYNQYEAHSMTQTWCALPRANRGGDDQRIVGNLTKGELKALYTKGMVSSSGAARNVYDQIKLLARDDCPYCGDCGEIVVDDGIGTLDHFLPKAYFPAFSVLPLNLVPACAVCNTGLGSSFPTDPNLQPLHPYFDAPHFYDEKWTTAIVIEGDPVVVNFEVSPPAGWTDKDKRRISKYFEDCKLRGRYRKRAASDISSLIDLRRTVHRNLPPDNFKKILTVLADNEALPLNGWKRTLHHGLANSEWFCSHDFSQ